MKNIEQKIENISEEDIDTWVAKDAVDFLKPKINFFADDIFGFSEVARKAFREMALQKIKKSAKTFILTKKHWKTGRSLEAYLRKTVKHLYLAEKYADLPSKIIYLCPGCGFFSDKEICSDQGQNLSCTYCLSMLEDKARSKVASIFAFHSKTGYECPECQRFIPESYCKEHNVECPFDDCVWFGIKSELKTKTHPRTTVTRTFVREQESADIFNLCKDEDPGPLLKLEVQKQTEHEFNILKQVLETQSQRLEKRPIEKNIKKRLMYQAFSNMLKKDPEGMIRYLVHQKSGGGDLPIQSQIFQEFIKLVENNLPFFIIKNGKRKEILSLLDNDLDLFLGKSEFEAETDSNSIIHNKTKEVYIGGRKMKDFGPCFIGHLYDVIGPEGSLKNSIEYYTFSQIKLKDVRPGTKVLVKHLRIPSHYEMNGLVFLQRVRRKVVDSVYQRINGEKRETKAQYEKNKKLC